MPQVGLYGAVPDGPLEQAEAIADHVWQPADVEAHVAFLAREATELAALGDALRLNPALRVSRWRRLQARGTMRATIRDLLAAE